MEQPRRIELMPAEPVDPPRKEEKQSKTLRFDLTLAEPSESSCSEFSYIELLKKASEEKDKNGNEKQTNGTTDDPFGDENEDNDKLMALAMSFEAKYGPKPEKKKKKMSSRIQDLVDLGEGYDENDPFIDNSEAYDELVPATLTTKYGGFYINSGTLDFREVSEDSDVDDFQVQRKKKKIKQINSDSESENVPVKWKRGPKKKKFKEDGEMLVKKKRKKLSSTDGEKPVKKKKMSVDGDFIRKRGRPKKQPPTVADLIKLQALSGSNQSSQLNNSMSQDAYSSSSNMDEGVSVNIDAAIDSVIARAAAEADAEEEWGKKVAPTPESVPHLPEHLPSCLIQDIETLKQAAIESDVGKSKFFDSSVNKVLLNIEMQVQKQPAAVRQTVYAYLAAYLPCGQQTLIKRAKKLRLSEQDDKLKEPLQKLKDAIDRAMPALWEEYNADCKAVAQARSEKLEKEIKEGTEGAPAKEGGSTESDEEKKDEAGEAGEKEKRIMMPRKKFKWNFELKSLLDDIVRIKMEMFDANKSKTETAEDYLRGFLDTEVKDLWPKGWIQTRMLFKESRNVHSRWTNNPQLAKPKKTVILGASQASQSSLGASTSLLASVSASMAAVNNEKVSSSVIPTAEVSSSQGLLAGRKDPVPTLLDYATEKYFSAGKSKTIVTSAVDVSSNESLSTSTPHSLSFTTTTMLRTPAMEALKNMGVMAGITKPHDSKASQQSGQLSGTAVSHTSQAASAPLGSQPSQATSSNTQPTGLVTTASSLLNSHQSSHVTSSKPSGQSFISKFQEFVDPKPAQVTSSTNSDFLSKYKEYAEKQRHPEAVIPKTTLHVNSTDSKPQSFSSTHVSSATKPKPRSSTPTSTHKTTIAPSQPSSLSQVYSSMQLPPATSAFPTTTKLQTVYTPSYTGTATAQTPTPAHTNTSRPVPTYYTTVSSTGHNSTPVSSQSMSHKTHSPNSQKQVTSQQSLHSNMMPTTQSQPQQKKTLSPSSSAWSPKGQAVDSSYSQYTQRSSASHVGYGASSVSPQPNRTSQPQRRTSISQPSPSTPDKTLTTSIPPNEPLFGGMTMSQLEAQAMAAANMNRSSPSQTLNTSPWRPEHSTSSAFSLSHGSKLPSTTAYSTDSLNRPSANSYNLNMFDIAQLSGAAAAHKVLSPDTLLPPGGNIFSHQNLAGSGASLNPQGLSAQSVLPHLHSSPRRTMPTPLPYGQPYSDPQSQHRY